MFISASILSFLLDSSPKEKNGGEVPDTPLVTPEEEEAVAGCGNSQPSVTSKF